MKARYIFSLMPLLATKVFAAENETFTRVSNDCTDGILSSHDWASGNGTLACGSFIELVSVEALPDETPDGALQERQACRPSRSTYYQHEVIRSGTWWGPWKKASGCLWCGLSKAQCDLQINWSYTVGRTLSAGFGVDSLATITKIISATPSLNLGFQWTESRTEGGAITCRANPGEPASYWAQYLMGWSDSQSRQVTEILNAQCGSRYSYGSWLGIGRADWPLKGNGAQNYGCSAGAAAEC
ncbi:hypothetical protein CPLU01_12148 [Colletotrichum plurivorum]|uniref:Uncharacterized protein n=1 Tax=Colletotrichum plurivorum TaxID=2175906 RepID=A0A8H6N7F2_9PEZI|nr:hypothetical protein CPLU01_12148 [Colletotrichum plurivorum]